MRAISLWQPWASGVARRLKGIETRDWSTRHRGPIAIHAAQRWSADQRAIAQELGFLPASPRPEWNFNDTLLPLGYILAVTEIIDVKPTRELLNVITRDEWRWGDYGPDRYGWIFGRVHVFPQPLRFKGRQGIFKVPDEVLQPSVPDWCSQVPA